MQMLDEELDWYRGQVDRLLDVRQRHEEQIAEAWDEVDRLRGENTRLQAKIDAARLLIADSYDGTRRIDGADLYAALDVEP